MNDHSKDSQTRYLREAAIVLAKEGFQLDEVHTDRLCILLDDAPLCEVTESGGIAYANREDLERNLPQSNKAENADMRGAYAVSGRGGIAHEPAVDKPRRRGGKQMKTYGEEDL